MHTVKNIFLLAIVAIGLFGCASSARSTRLESGMPPAALPSKVTAVGYGAMPVGEGLSAAQRHLLAMRAAKLDAYRALAETVAGIKIIGNSTVSAMALTSDSYRAYIEAYLRGARIVTITPLPDGAFETVLELNLGGDFYQAVSMPEVRTPETAPMANPKRMDVTPMPVSAPQTNFYLSL